MVERTIQRALEIDTLENEPRHQQTCLPTCEVPSNVGIAELDIVRLILGSCLFRNWSLSHVYARMNSSTASVLAKNPPEGDVVLGRYEGEDSCSSWLGGDIEGGGYGLTRKLHQRNRLAGAKKIPRSEMFGGRKD